MAMMRWEPFREMEVGLRRPETSGPNCWRSRCNERRENAHYSPSYATRLVWREWLTIGGSPALRVGKSTAAVPSNRICAWPSRSIPYWRR
jgi:hypothetical protein